MIPVFKAWIPSSGSWQRPLLGHALTLQGNCAIVIEGLGSLLVFAFKHHLQLLPSSLSVISFFSIDDDGFQVFYGSGIEDFPVL